jgi:N-acetylneuraminate synthase/sialic acid synthase
MRQFTVNGFRVDDDSDCYVIAEIGHNHQGSLEKAKQLFAAAAEAGVQAVKLQTRDNRSLFTRSVYDAPYDNPNSYGATYGEHREALELGPEQYLELKKFAEELGLTLFSTPFDIPSANLLESLDMPLYKIASGDLTNTPLLEHVAKFQKPMIVSTGGGTIEDVKRAYHAIMSINPRLCLMQCTAAYPSEPEDMNLRVIETYRERFPDAVIGLSDHQNGISMALVAYVLGARMVEKHFTLNRAWKGTDHAFSLEPTGLTKLVRDLKRARVALGDGVKQRLPIEEKPLYKMGKKLVAGRDLPANHVLTEADIAVKSPSDGLPPYELKNVIGKRLARALAEDENISFEDLA